MKCSKCGKELPADAKFCPSCGSEIIAKEEKPAAAAPSAAKPAESVTPVLAPIEDPFLKKWNWGAFLLNWIWAFGHGLAIWGVIGLLAWFVPLIGHLAVLGIAIYLGVRGSELAWQTGRYPSIEVLKEAERVWTKWAVIILIISIVLASLITAFGIAIAIALFSEYYLEYMLFL